MDADLDTLCTVVYCTADDLLPEARANARRRVIDAEVVTLCVAQAIMGIASSRLEMSCTPAGALLGRHSGTFPPGVLPRHLRVEQAVDEETGRMRTGGLDVHMQGPRSGVRPATLVREQ